MCALVTGVQTCALPIYKLMKRTVAGADNLEYYRGSYYSHSAATLMYDFANQLSKDSCKCLSQITIALLTFNLHSGFVVVGNCRTHRSAERRVGKVCVSMCRSRWSQLY